MLEESDHRHERMTVQTLPGSSLEYQTRGQNMPVAIVLGGPTLDKLAALAGVPPETPDFEVLSSFYGHPAQLVKCETNDLLVPANAEIVLEGEVITTEGWVHDGALRRVHRHVRW